MIFKVYHGAVLSLSILLATALIVGCGGAPEGPPVYSTTGKITLDGNPLSNAMVEFSPHKQAGDQVPTAAIGNTDEEGNYVMYTRGYKGCGAGDFKVGISTFAEPSDEEIGEEEGTGKAESVPAAYRGEASNLKATVTSDGENVFNFDLKSDGS